MEGFAPCHRYIEQVTRVACISVFKWGCTASEGYIIFSFLILFFRFVSIY